MKTGLLVSTKIQFSVESVSLLFVKKGVMTPCRKGNRWNLTVFILNRFVETRLMECWDAKRYKEVGYGKFVRKRLGSLPPYLKIIRTGHLFFKRCPVRIEKKLCLLQPEYIVSVVMSLYEKQICRQKKG